MSEAILLDIRDEMRGMRQELRGVREEQVAMRHEQVAMRHEQVAMRQELEQTNLRLESVEEALGGFAAQVTMLSAAVTAGFQQRFRVAEQLDDLTHRVERLEQARDEE